LTRRKRETSSNFTNELVNMKFYTVNELIERVYL